MQILVFSLAGNYMHLTIVELKSLRWIREEECWKKDLQLHFFIFLFFMSSNSRNLVVVVDLVLLMVFVLKTAWGSWHQEWYVHISVKALKLLEVQRGFFFEAKYSTESDPTLGVVSQKKKLKSRNPNIFHFIIYSDSQNLVMEILLIGT